MRGVGDGQPFTVDADFLEDHKRLEINGEPQDDVVAANSYEEVIKTFAAWSRTVPYEQLMGGRYPHPAFAHIAYQLSSVLWRSSRDARTISLSSASELLAFDAAFAESVSGCHGSE